VELVGDGLDGRSEWARRAPLLLSHPRWALLDGCREVFLFAGAPDWLSSC
jgi:hypothetical protein